MDNPFDDVFNTLSYDERVIGDKLGMAFSDPRPEPRPGASIEARLRNKMRENAVIRDLVSREVRREVRREPFVLKQEKDDPSVEPMCGRAKQASAPAAHGGGCNCAECRRARLGASPAISDVLDDRTLMFLVFIMFVFCVVQYMNYQTLQGEVHDMHMLLHQLTSGAKKIE
jgi:hypothetical protein